MQKKNAALSNEQVNHSFTQKLSLLVPHEQVAVLMKPVLFCFLFF